jgi:hypothetical protein
MRSSLFSIYISLLRNRQLPAIYSNVRNMAAESGGRKREIRAPGPLQFEVLKGFLMFLLKRNRVSVLYCPETKFKILSPDL